MMYTNSTADPKEINGYLSDAVNIAIEGDVNKGRAILDGLLQADKGLLRSAEYWGFRARYEMAAESSRRALETLALARQHRAEPESAIDVASTYINSFMDHSARVENMRVEKALPRLRRTSFLNSPGFSLKSPLVVMRDTDLDSEYVHERELQNSLILRSPGTGSAKSAPGLPPALLAIDQEGANAAEAAEGYNLLTDALNL